MKSLLDMLSILISYNSSNKDIILLPTNLYKCFIYSIQFADGLIIFRDTDKPVIQEYLANQDNNEYVAKISKMKELQIDDEKMTKDPI